MSENRHDVTIIAGISGVGKSYLINGLKQLRPYTHFSAGTLINKRKIAERDKLRELPAEEILRNQYLLVEQFVIELDEVDTSTPILFDAHMLIDNDQEIIPIPLDIFRGLRANRIIYISDKPRIIADRRSLDASRTRPTRSVEALDDQQKQSVQLAQAYANELGVPFFSISGAECASVEALINGNAT